METASGIELTDAARGFLKALASDTRQQILLLFAGGVELTVGRSPSNSAWPSRPRPHIWRRFATAGCWLRGGSGRPSITGPTPAGIGRALADLQLSLQACCPPNACTPDAACG